MTAKFDLHKSVCFIGKVIILVALVYIRMMSEGQTISYLAFGVESLFVIAFIIGLYSINAMIKNYKFLCKKYSQYRGVLAYIKFGKHLMIIMIIVGLIQAIFSQLYATYILKSSQSAILLLICSGILIASIGTCLFLYFYHAIRFYTPLLISMISWLLTALIGILVISPKFSQLGSKVALLLQNETFASIYRSLSILLIILIGVGISFLINIAFYFVYGKKYIAKLKKNDPVKNIKIRDNYGKVFQMGIRDSSMDLFLHSLIMIGIFLYQAMSPVTDLYLLGEYIIVVEIIIGIISTICSYSLKNIEFRCLYYQKEETGKAARKEAITGIRWALYVSIIYGTIMIVVAPYLARLIFSNYASEILLFQIAGLMLPGLLLSAFFVKLNLGLKQIKFVTRSYLICIAVYLLSVAILFKVIGVTVISLGIAKLIVIIIFTIMNYIILEGQITILLETMMYITIPIAIAVISGFVVAGLNKLWAIYLGDFFTVLLSVFLLLIFYFVGIVGVRSIKKDEMQKMPGGMVVKKIASALHLV